MTELTIREHLKILAKNSIYLMIMLVIVFFVAWAFADTIIGYIIRYFDYKLYALTPYEYLDVQIQMAFLVTLIFAIPSLLVVLYLYLKSEIPANISRLVKYYIGFVTMLAISGAAFGFFIFARLSFDTFIYNPNGVIAMWGIKSFFTYIFLSCISFAIFFQIVILIPLSDRYNIIKAKILGKGRLYVLLGSSLLSGWLTPSMNIAPQLMMMIPLYLCFEMGIIISKIMEMRLWHLA